VDRGPVVVERSPILVERAPVIIAPRPAPVIIAPRPEVRVEVRKGPDVHVGAGHVDVRVGH
jgi:hypothetical protein